MEIETIYFVCKICNQGITKGNLSNSGMLNQTCKDCIPIRDDRIILKYLNLKEMGDHQYDALGKLGTEYNLALDTIKNIIAKTKRRWANAKADIQNK